MTSLQSIRMLPADCPNSSFVSDIILTLRLHSGMNKLDGRTVGEAIVKVVEYYSQHEGLMSNSIPTVQIIIPVYNEGNRTEGVVAGIQHALLGAGFTYAILILNDGSTDWTSEIEAQLLAYKNVGIRNCGKNRGKGAVLNDVFSDLDADYTVVIDADNEYSPKDIPLILGPLFDGAADYVMGSRYGFGRPRPNQYLLTYIANRFFNMLFNYLSGLRLNDLLTGLYAFKTQMVKDVSLQEERFSFVPELAWRVHNSKQPRWKEVPIDYKFRKYSDGKKIQWWEFFTVSRAILHYRHSKLS